MGQKKERRKKASVSVRNDQCETLKSGLYKAELDLVTLCSAQNPVCANT